MGLTKTSVGIKATDFERMINKTGSKIIALAGNPNVGKSTLFNALTGLNQHTGNWSGKTVGNAIGSCEYNGKAYTFVDIPGTYSILAHSAEEEIARDFICFGEADTVAIVCDATCLERNLNLVLQILEITSKALVCVNLMDEAKRKGISINIEKLSSILGVPVVAITARKKKSINSFLNVLELADKRENHPLRIKYSNNIESAISVVSGSLIEGGVDAEQSRWMALRLIEGDVKLSRKIKDNFFNSEKVEALENAIAFAKESLRASGINIYKIKDMIVSQIFDSAEKIANDVVCKENSNYTGADRKIDSVLTGKYTAFPIMLLMLGVIFWITIKGANYPSRILSDFLMSLEGKISDLLGLLKFPDWLNSLITEGAYRVLAWVVSVMLPPMAIFFPLFTLLEDAGILPRIAYNLDRPFKRCNACGKQALTMCMGFGCNAAGVVGCRIIDSPRERLLAVLTNSFVPCNGRFPMLITLITILMYGFALEAYSSFIAAIVLMMIIILGVLATFGSTYILSKTLLKGRASAFTLEMPPYRVPQFGKVFLRSVLDRTVFVLARAVVVAIPAGALIWAMSNIKIEGNTLLMLCSNLLDPFARLIGLDGVILMAFILGFPANEIVIPIMIMAYSSNSVLSDVTDIYAIKDLFVSNGWTWVTALCTMVFSLMHWPCSTTLITIKKETESYKWAAVGFVLPTLFGIVCCGLINIIGKLIV